MKEELRGPKVENVSVAVVKEEGEDGEFVHNVYLINEREDLLDQVLITSKGYATDKDSGEKIETNTLRRLMGEIAPLSTTLIEPIMEDVMGLNNEYWVSFWIGDTLYDKKYIFLPETIKEENYVTVPLMNKKGVLVG